MSEMVYYTVHMLGDILIVKFSAWHCFKVQDVTTTL